MLPEMYLWPGKIPISFRSLERRLRSLSAVSSSALITVHFKLIFWCNFIFRAIASYLFCVLILQHTVKLFMFWLASHVAVLQRELFRFLYFRDCVVN